MKTEDALDSESQAQLPLRAELVCPICCQVTEPVFTLWDDRYGFPGRFALSRCSSCGHLSLRPTLDSAQIESLYTNFYPRSTFDVERWSPAPAVNRAVMWWSGLRSSAFRWVPRNVRVLDIGCGFGESLGYHRNRGCDAHGVEADANILRVAARHNLQVKAGLFRAADYEPASFDVVTLDQVIEHVADPVAVLRDVAAVLKPGGLAILSTPNARGWGAAVFGRRWINWHAPYHQQFFTIDSMTKAAGAAGLRVVASQTITNSAWLHFQWCHLATPAVEGTRSAFWNPTLPRSGLQRVVLTACSVVNRLGVNALLTRIFDGVGLGDNRVFVLRNSRQ